MVQHWPLKILLCNLLVNFFKLRWNVKKSRVTIVGATSGDTGSAAIEAFRGLDAVNVFILYPNGRVSDVQRRQMTTPSEKKCFMQLPSMVIFDDCQAHLKDMFNDFEFSRRSEVSRCEFDKLGEGFSPGRLLLLVSH